MLHTRSPERGQAVPLLLAVLALAVAAAVLVVRLATASVERSRAQTAADAAALAGAVHGDGAAVAAARANGADVVDTVSDGDVVTVEVRYRRALASAAAEAGAAVSSNDPVRAGLAPVMVAALDRADAVLGRSVQVTSGYRSPAEQEDLWTRRRLNPNPVAPPGTSMHEAGLAVDVAPSEVAALLAVADVVGLCQPLPQGDPVHFEPCLPTPP
jgi:uncharacterized protein YcbK (DUF882 family)